MNDLIPPNHPTTLGEIQYVKGAGGERSWYAAGNCGQDSAPTPSLGTADGITLVRTGVTARLFLVLLEVSIPLVDRRGWNSPWPMRHDLERGNVNGTGSVNFSSLVADRFHRHLVVSRRNGILISSGVTPPPCLTSAPSPVPWSLQWDRYRKTLRPHGQVRSRRLPWAKLS